MSQAIRCRTAGYCSQLRITVSLLKAAGLPEEELMLFPSLGKNAREPRQYGETRQRCRGLQMRVLPALSSSCVAGGAGVAFAGMRGAASGASAGAGSGRPRPRLLVPRRPVQPAPEAPPVVESETYRHPCSGGRNSAFGCTRCGRPAGRRPCRRSPFGSAFTMFLSCPSSTRFSVKNWGCRLSSRRVCDARPIWSRSN